MYRQSLRRTNVSGAAPDRSLLDVPLCYRFNTATRFSQVLMDRVPELLFTNVSAAGFYIASVAREPGS
jgi:hypothetical protein